MFIPLTILSQVLLAFGIPMIYQVDADDWSGGGKIYATHTVWIAPSVARLRVYADVPVIGRLTIQDREFIPRPSFTVGKIIITEQY